MRGNVERWTSSSSIVVAITTWEDSHVLGGRGRAAPPVDREDWSRSDVCPFNGYPEIKNLPSINFAKILNETLWKCQCILQCERGARVLRWIRVKLKSNVSQMKIAINSWCENLRFDLYFHRNYSVFRPSNSSRSSCLDFRKDVVAKFRFFNFLSTPHSNLIFRSDPVFRLLGWNCQPVKHGRSNIAPSTPRSRLHGYSK